MNSKVQRRIQTYVQDLDSHYDGDVLHILNGSAMYERFQMYQLHDLSKCVPFNEAMCTHSTDHDIFSKSFIQKRAAGHDLLEADYEKRTIEPLRPLFERKYAYVVLWFGADMFCQMNMLTMLAYLEDIYDLAHIQVQIVNEQTYEMASVELNDISYHSIYKSVLIQRQVPIEQGMPVLAKGIQLYLHYIQESNEITDYILTHCNLSQKTLLNQLFETFPNYGLGDVQYIKMINTVLGTQDEGGARP